MIAMLRTRDGVGLAYDVRGEGEDVVFVHGLGLSRRRWDAQVQAVADAGYRAVRFDLRGFGESEMPTDPYDMPTLVADLALVADEIAQEPFHLVGHSLGGMISLRYTLEHPERVRTLTVASTTAHNGRRASAFAGGMARISELGFDAAVREPEIASLVQQVLEAGFGEDAPPLTHFRRGLEEPNLPHAYAWRATQGFSVRDDIDALEPPLLVLHGDADPLIPFRFGEWIARTVPDARFVALPGAGHSIQVERADAFSDALLRFLDEEG